MRKISRVVSILTLVLVLFAEGSWASSKTIEVIDQNGMKAVVPTNVSRVITTAMPLPSIYALTGAPIEKLVGMHPGSASAIKNSVMSTMYPKLLSVPTNFIKDLDINIEEMMNLKPDVVLFWATYLNQYELMKTAGIPAIGLKVQGSGDVLTTLESWLKIMGKVMGTSSSTERVIAYGRKVQKEVAQSVSGIPKNKRARSLYLYQHSEKEIIASGRNDYRNFWIESSGGVNVAASLDGNATVNMEQIYEWDPEIIFLTTFTPTMPDDLYKNRVRGQDWSGIAAVKNKKVFKEPLGVYRWSPPSGDAPLMFLWMAQKQYPDRFKYDMGKEIIKYYKEFYNYNLTKSQAQGILEANSEAAKGAQF